MPVQTSSAVKIISRILSLAYVAEPHNRWARSRCSVCLPSTQRRFPVIAAPGRDRAQQGRSLSLACTCWCRHVRYAPVPELLSAESVQALTPLQTGLAFLPFSIGIIIGSAIASKALPRLGEGCVMAIGLSRLAAAADPLDGII